MSHDYNMRTKKQEGENSILVAIGNLETKFLDGFSSFKHKVINLKDVIIRGLLEENAKLRNRVEVLENKFNHLKQYGRCNNIEVPGIPDSVGDNELECSVIKFMKAVDIEVDDHDIEACHRIGKSKRDSKKTIVHFCNRKFSIRALYNKKKLASVSTSAVGRGNSTKLFISENLADYHNKLAFNCRELKRASSIHSTFTRDGIVHIMKSDRGKSKKITHLSRLVELFPNFYFHDEE